MVDVRLLNAEIVKAGLTRGEVAIKIGITPKTFYLKEKRGVFGSDEIEKIVKVCNIADPMPIFFPDFVAQQGK